MLWWVGAAQTDVEEEPLRWPPPRGAGGAQGEMEDAAVGKRGSSGGWGKDVRWRDPPVALLAEPWRGHGHRVLLDVEM